MKASGAFLKSSFNFLAMLFCKVCAITRTPAFYFQRIDFVLTLPFNALPR
jgi:hypothetical protein